MTQIDSGPARPGKLRSTFTRSGDELHLHCRIRMPGGFFLMLWLTGWTVGCVFLAVETVRKPATFTILFGIPFWASWIFVFLYLLKAFFQEEDLWIDAAGARFTRRVFVVVVARSIPLEEIKGVTGYTAVVDSESNATQPGLELQTVGKPVRMLQSLPAAELDWLKAQLNDHLAALRARVATPAVGALTTPADGDEHASGEEEDASMLILSPVVTEPPADSSWRRADVPGEIQFVRRGRLNVLAIGGLLFIALFWNGVVSVFVTVLWGGAPVKNGPARWSVGWWGLFVFLIPFEVIGLIMAGALLMAVLEPARRTRWSLSADAIESRDAWLGAGLRRNWRVGRLSRLDLQREEKSRRMLWPEGAESAEATFYRVVFVDEGNVELCAIRRLTEGEARWMAQTILRERAEWFR